MASLPTESWEEDAAAGGSLPRWLAVFGAAAAVRLVTQVAIWAYDRGLLGPRDAGQRILLGLPLVAVRLLRDAAAVVAIYAGGNLLAAARQRWTAYQQEIRVLAPLPPSAPPPGAPGAAG
jgi:hypothetical protein